MIRLCEAGKISGLTEKRHQVSQGQFRFESRYATISIMSKRIIFLGSPEFAVPSLRGLAQNFEIVGVVTQPDRPAGRGNIPTPPPVKRLAVDLKLPVIQPNRMKDTGVIEQLVSWAPDVLVVVAFGQILRQNVLDLAPFGCINVHASLLPRWQGAAPIQRSILAGDTQTGVTIMKLDAGIDTGPTLSKTVIHINENENAQELSNRLAVIGSELLAKTLPEYLDGKIIPQPQDETNACYASMLKKEDANLDFHQSAVEIARKIRAFYPWPGTQFLWGEKWIKILKGHSLDAPKGTPGVHLVDDGLPGIQTGNGVIIIDTIQIPGKKPMDGRDFLRGTRNWLD